MSIEAEHVCSVGAELGEGPVWVRRERAVWFVNIKGRKVHRFDPASGELAGWPAPEQPGFIAPCRQGDFVVGLKTGLHRFDPRTGVFAHLTQVEPDKPDNRLNDGAVCPAGTLWFGSMDDLETNASGSLYHLDAQGRCVALDRGYVITNGPAFSPDGRVFYHTNTSERVVYVFDRPTPGTVTGKRVFVKIEDGAGWPDGTAVDAEGCVWVAMWGGWSELLSSVRFPCANVTKISFGGEDGRTAYATTAWKGLSAQERASQPLAGDLFRFRTEVPGQPSVELAQGV